ncbi:MAG: ferredoxin--NADP reductase [Planctomycetota bacterium]
MTAKKVWTDGLFTLSIRCDQVQPFKTGQFLHLALGEDADRVNRPYSVASPHSDTLEFFIVVVEEGELTPRLWKLEPGDNVQVSERAAGSFTLKRTPDAEILWLISTGTGLAPYIAMLRTKEPWERFEKIVVIHGVRHHQDLAYSDELAGYSNKYRERFRLIQSLTRENKDGYLHGRIPKLVESGELERSAGWEMNKDNSSVLLCGNPAMLNDMEETLGSRDMRKHRSKLPGQIVLERYW